MAVKIRIKEVAMKRVAESTELRITAFIVGLFAILAAIAFIAPTNAYAADMYRMYNPNSGEHFYTASTAERNSLYIAGWDYEGIGWVAPDSGEDVYRLYNSNAGDHHYTPNAAERDFLINQGWKYEGVGWKTGGAIPLFRQYNPNAKAGSHNFTTSSVENDSLVRAGWIAEGIGWYGTGYGRADSMPADVVRPTPKPPTVTTPNTPSITETVYVTPSGKSYHRASCASTKNSRLTALSLSTAIARGYSPCKVCKPTGY